MNLQYHSLCLPVFSHASKKCEKTDADFYHHEQTVYNSYKILLLL